MYDNAKHLLEGTATDNAKVVRIEAYDGTTLLKPKLNGTQWTLTWQPQDTSRMLRVLAYDAVGNVGERHLEFRSLALNDPAELAQPDLLLRLPTAPDTVTRYTLDGSVPTPASPVYQGPLVLRSRAGQPAPLSLIPANKFTTSTEIRWERPQGEVRLATVVRAQQFRNGGPVGPVLTRTYLIDQARYTLPVVSLVINPDDFFSPNRGIYVPGSMYDQSSTLPPIKRPGNYNQKGKDWERPVHVEWFEPDGHLGVSQDAGVRIKGGVTARYPKKSLTLNAGSEYGLKTFDYPFFPGLPVKSFKSLVVRGSGQDFIWTKFKECVLHDLLAQQAQLDIQACRPAVMFINGEYWGLYNLREQNDKTYLAAHSNLSSKDIVILNGLGLLDEGKIGDDVPYQTLIDFVSSHNLAEPANYAQVTDKIDIDNFIDYNIFQIYIANLDWPQNNVKIWRARLDAYKPGASAGLDGRWRWMVFDADISLFNPEINSLSRALGQNPELPVEENLTLLLSRLMSNPTFKSRFIDRFRAQMLTVYSPERGLAVINQFAQLLAPEIPEEIRRWSYPASIKDWQSNVENLRYFVKERPAYMAKFLNELKDGR